MTKKRDVATPGEWVKLNDRLRVVCEVLGDGFCAYAEGFNDEVLAAELGIGLNSVRRFRQDYFGSIRIPAAKAKAEAPAPADRRVDRLEDAFLNMAAAYAELLDRHNRLCAQLSVNQIMDCRHLVLKGALFGTPAPKS